MKKLDVPRGTQIIECKSIDFIGKDIVLLEKWEDFLWLLGGNTTIFKLKKSFYNISGEVAFIFELNGMEVK